MADILSEIITFKRRYVAERKELLPLSVVEEKIAGADPPRGFSDALKSGGISLIAEIKRASPSAGLIRPDLDVPEIARTYEAGGASAISVLTDEKFFMGSPGYLREVRKATQLPVLRKDFIVDIYQVYESRALGADAFLLIVSALSSEELSELICLSSQLGMDALVEAHSESEIELAVSAGAEIIGINNRNLRTFDVDIGTTLKLLGAIPEGKITVSESGIKSREDVLALENAGVDAILVGESLMREDDIGAKMREFLGR